MRSRKLLIGVTALALSLASLTGCSQLSNIGSGNTDSSENSDSGNKLDALMTYVQTREPEEILTEAQMNIENSEYVKAQIGYKFKFMDRAVSSRIYEDDLDCTIRKFPEGERYSRTGLKPDGSEIFEYVYIVPTEQVAEQDGSNAINDVSEPYSKFVSYDGDKTWEKVGVNDLWGTHAIDAIDFTKLIGADLTLDKGQKMIDDIYTFHMGGNLTWEQAQAFIGGLTEVYGIESAQRATGAKNIKFDAYFYQNCRPYLFTISFEDGSDVNSDFVFTEWTITAQYGDVESGQHLSVPDYIRDQVIVKAREKAQEESYNLGGIKIEIETEPEVETDAEGNPIETGAVETDADGNPIASTDSSQASDSVDASQTSESAGATE